MEKSTIKGSIFEILILKMVLKSGYHLIQPIKDIEKNKYRLIRKRFLEIKGRGEYHQIDIPVDLDYAPPFIYPIRMLGEVKCYSTKLSKDIVRAEIGKMKDIQENYFVDKKTNLDDVKKYRRTEVFSIFSAEGFDLPAEKLAYAHNIKTISYEDCALIEIIKIVSEELAEYISHKSEITQKKYIDGIYDNLINGRKSSFPYYIDTHILRLENYYNSIKTSIIATTESGLTLHLLSNNNFPDLYFEKSDTAMCMIRKDEYGWHIKIKDYKLYFSMPKLLLNEYKVNSDGVMVYPKKEDAFSKIYVSKEINGIIRTLTLIFDKLEFIRIMNR